MRRVSRRWRRRWGWSSRVPGSGRWLARRGAEQVGDAGPLVGVRERLGQMDHDAAHGGLAGGSLA
jgi:hypothetical protein